MKPHERLCLCHISTVLAIMILFLQGCASLQISSKNGRPRIVGCGYTKSFAGTNGQVYQIITPGIALRTGSFAPGISFGWFETRLIYPATPGSTNSPALPVAIQTKCLGVDLAPVHIMVGFESAFAIPLPKTGKSVVQIIQYSENSPTNTVAKRKEIQ
jgi:hypothetical protein